MWWCKLTLPHMRRDRCWMTWQMIALSVAGTPVRRARAAPPFPRANEAYDTLPQNSDDTLATDVNKGLEVYVDSSWAAKFSCSGALYFYHGCMIHWFAKMQKSVTLSSAEAEFFGAMLAAKDAIFLRELLIDLDITVAGPTVLYCDSKSAVDLAFDPVAFKNTKHILRAAEFLRDLVARRVVTVKHVKGTVMLADILTKACARAIFVELLRLLDDYATSGQVVVS